MPDKDLNGDVGVHRFWKSGCFALFDIRITDTDAPYQCRTDPMVCLTKHKKEKKQQYLEHCMDRIFSFTPLVFLVDRLNPSRQ